MLPIIMGREFIARSTRMPHFPARLSTSASSHHDLSLAGFITNIAESDFRYTQAAFQTSTLDRTEGIAGKLGIRFLLVPENVRNRWSSSANRGAELPATAATVDQSIGKP
jgi:hypothetical protein